MDRRARGSAGVGGATLVAIALLCCAGCRAHATGLNSQGARLYTQGNSAAAQAKFAQAIQSDPKNADGYYNLAVLTHQLGRQSKNRTQLDQAELLYNQCLDRNTNHVDCRRALAVLLVDEGRNDSAFKLMQNWIKESPSLPDARIELARLYDEFGEKDAAKQYLQESLTLDPYSARALAALGRWYEKEGDYAQALANYQRSLQSNQMQTEVAQRIAALQRAVGPVPPTTTPPVPGAPRTVANPNGATR